MSTRDRMAMPLRPILGPAILGPALAGWAAMAVGLGLARFAYGPLVPALVQAQWFSPGGAALHGALNLVGYVAGAAVARHLSRQLPLRAVLRAAMLLAALSLLVSAPAPPGAVFGLARFLGGVAGGVLMVLGPPSVLAIMPQHLRGRASGLVFSGVGVGIAFSALALPELLAHGLGAAWLGLGGAALLLALLSWPAWPDAAAAASAPAAGDMPRPALRRLVLGYAIGAAAIVPHMLLLSDFVARGLGHGIATGALAFAVYGVGAALGPVLGGLVADRLGFRRTLSGAVALQAAAVLAPALWPTLPVAIVSGLVVGALTPGIPPLVLGRAIELGGPLQAGRSWGSATIGYALFQAAAAWGLAALFAATGSYWPGFAGGAVIALVSRALMSSSGTPVP